MPLETQLATVLHKSAGVLSFTFPNFGLFLSGELSYVLHILVVDSSATLNHSTIDIV